MVVALAGGFDLTLSDGTQELVYRLNRPTHGLLVGPMLYISMANFEEGSLALSLASTHYDPAKSIRSWQDYLVAIRE